MKPVLHTMKICTSRLAPLFATAAALLPAGALAQQAGAPPPGSAAHGATLEEIVVTAERRSSRLQDVPISITALTPDALQRANITSTRDLAMLTPGLRIESTGIFAQPNIRGI